MAAPPPPQPQPSESPIPNTWAVAAGVLAVGAATLRFAWSTLGRGDRSAEHGAATGLPPLPPLASPEADAARAAVRQAGQHLAASAGSSAAAAAGAVAPLVVAAATAGAYDETPLLTMEQLESMAREMCLLIQQARRMQALPECSCAAAVDCL